MVLSLQRLTEFYRLEIERGLAGLGNYSLRPGLQPSGLVDVCCGSRRRRPRVYCGSNPHWNTDGPARPCCRYVVSAVYGHYGSVVVAVPLPITIYVITSWYAGRF